MSGFRHVAMFTWTADATAEQRRAVPELLAGLPEQIPEIASYSFGADAGVNPGNHDFVLVADFADRESYVVYRDHPKHRAVTDSIAPIVARRAAVQYEL